MSEGKLPQRKRLLSPKELSRLVVLILFTVAGVVVLFNRWPTIRSSSSPSPVLVTAEEKAAIKKVTPVPFEKNPALLTATEDDKYLKTAGFYYLIHQMMASSADEAKSSLVPSLDWQALKKLFPGLVVYSMPKTMDPSLRWQPPTKRQEVRGKVLRARGGLVKLQKLELSGEEAKERGLEGAVVWEGAIYNSQGHLYLFVATDVPGGLRKDEEVELCGVFFKVWVYENREDRWSYAPVLVGKTLQVLPRASPKGPKQLAWVVLTLLTLTGIFLVGALWYERSKKSDFSKQTWQRRKRKLKEGSRGKGQVPGSGEQSPHPPENP